MWVFGAQKLLLEGNRSEKCTCVRFSSGKLWSLAATLNKLPSGDTPLGVVFLLRHAHVPSPKFSNIYSRITCGLRKHHHIARRFTSIYQNKPAESGSRMKAARLLSHALISSQNRLSRGNGFLLRLCSLYIYIKRLFSMTLKATAYHKIFPLKFRQSYLLIKITSDFQIRLTFCFLHQEPFLKIRFRYSSQKM